MSRGPQAKRDPVEEANRRLLRRALLAAFAMFGFGFALVPLYDAFCEITGLNGKTAGPGAFTPAAEEAGREGRWVTLQLLASVNGGAAWEFRPQVRELKVRTGEPVVLAYELVNRRGELRIGQAVPSVAPGSAARHVRKLECFCFARQRVGAGERRVMPVRLVIDRDLPEEIGVVSLAYTFFDQPGS